MQIFTNSIGNFCCGPCLAMLFLVNAGYGGGFSTLPVLLDQHFGTKTVSTTHGLTLSAWAFAGLSGNQLASFVVARAPDQAHRYAALIPVLTGLFVVALISISLVKYLGDKNVTRPSKTGAELPQTTILPESGASIASIDVRHDFGRIVVVAVEYLRSCDAPTSSSIWGMLFLPNSTCWVPSAWVMTMQGTLIAPYWSLVQGKCETS